jgi:hypothetical protein
MYLIPSKHSLFPCMLKTDVRFFRPADYCNTHRVSHAIALGDSTPFIYLLSIWSHYLMYDPLYFYYSSTCEYY